MQAFSATTFLNTSETTKFIIDFHAFKVGVEKKISAWALKPCRLQVESDISEK
jgi:hypothetical protein